MNIGDYIALIIIAVIVLSAIIYIISQKKKGVKCIGCSHANKCNSCSCNAKK